MFSLCGVHHSGIKLMSSSLSHNCVISLPVILILTVIKWENYRLFEGKKWAQTMYWGGGKEHSFSSERKKNLLAFPRLQLTKGFSQDLSDSHSHVFTWWYLPSSDALLFTIPLLSVFTWQHAGYVCLPVRINRSQKPGCTPQWKCDHCSYV